jgi:hypothetical protein
VSSSWIVGRRFSKNWIAEIGPIVVTNWSFGTPAASSAAACARYSASASGIVKTCSIPICQPGRLPTSTMWLWASMMPGMTVRPPASITGTWSLRSTFLPTSTKRPFFTKTSSTMRFWPSIV